MTTNSLSPRVAILLATYNGARCLEAQLDSYCAQTHAPSLIVINDDGSSDDTHAILATFAQDHPELNVQIHQGPGRGAAQNFMHLLRQVPDDIDRVVLSDQDDIWLPEKIERALQEQGVQIAPALYCGRTLEWDEVRDTRRLSRLRPRTPCFRHAMVQNIAGGNTMMLNRAAIDLVQVASREARKVVVHDWWIYQIITGAGGAVVYDREPMVLYRQHADNLIGANRGLMAKWRRFRFLLSGRFRRWSTVNINALRASHLRLTDENVELLELFANGRNGPFWARLQMLRRGGFYRQGLTGQLSLYAAALLGRL